jgi:hypothetical protein
MGDTDRVREQAKALEPLPSPPLLSDPGPLQELCAGLAAAASALQARTRAAAALAGLAAS